MAKTLPMSEQAQLTKPIVLPKIHGVGFPKSKAPQALDPKRPKPVFGGCMVAGVLGFGGWDTQAQDGRDVAGEADLNHVHY